MMSNRILARGLGASAVAALLGTSVHPLAQAIRSSVQTWRYGGEVSFWPSAPFESGAVLSWLLGAVVVAVAATLVLTRRAGHWSVRLVAAAGVAVTSAYCVVIVVARPTLGQLGIVAGDFATPGPIPWTTVLTYGALGIACLVVAAGVPLEQRITWRARLVCALVATVLVIPAGWSSLAQAYRHLGADELPTWKLHWTAAQIWPADAPHDRVVTTDDGTYVLDPTDSLVVRSESVKQVRWRCDSSGHGHVVLLLVGTGKESLARRSIDRDGSHDALFVDDQLLTVAQWIGYTLDGNVEVDDDGKVYKALTGRTHKPCRQATRQ